MPRVVIPGVPHHITQRGVRSLPIFFDADDRPLYLELMRHHAARQGLHFATYCLMDNHVHLVAIPEREDSLQRAIGEAHRLYTLEVNLRMGTKGYLFQGRPFSCPLDDSHYLAALRYVERNPVRAGIVSQAWEYPWSGARFHLGLTPDDPLIDQDALTHFGCTPEDWHRLLQTELDEIQSLRERTRSGRPCGSDAFIADLETLTGRILCPHKRGRHTNQVLCGTTGPDC